MINNNETLGNLGIQQKSDIEQISSNKNATNPIKRENLLVDTYDFTSDALKMYQKEQDIKKFTSLAMSNPEDTSHIQLVAQDLINNKIDFTDDDEFLSSLLTNKEFLQALGE